MGASAWFFNSVTQFLFRLGAIALASGLLHPSAFAREGVSTAECFTSVAKLRAASQRLPVLLRLQALLGATSFAGSVPTPVGDTPADATISYGADSIVLSLHVVDPRPLFSDFRLSNRPESICVQGEQFYFLDGSNAKKYAFSVNGNNLTIQKDDHVLTMHPTGGGTSGSGSGAGETVRGRR
jgi:hypothetical protein